MTIRWLHLSDTHFREEDFWDRRATIRALIAKVRELKEKGLAPDMVFVTGDIAWSGKPKEYEQATRFFHKLNDVLELDPKDRWFLVPGNHDVDRSLITGSDKSIQAGLTDETTVEKTLRDPRSMQLLSARLEAYYAFAGNFLGPARALQPDRPWRTDVREVDDVSIGILQLNSAWIAEGGKADEANLLVGEAQVREALDATPDAFLRIALMHHPLRNLREFDANRVKARLSKSRGAAFLLRGHLHLNDTESQQSPDGHLLEIAAGTLYTDETNWPRGFHVGEIELDKGEARIRLFRYSGGGGDFFAPDNLTYENAPTGVCKIKLPPAYRLGSKKAKTAKTISEDQRLSFTARYRNAAAAYHGHARFVGFPNQAARPNAQVSDLFVPLRVKPWGGMEKGEPRTTAEIARRLIGIPQGSRARIVILGDPGSGKTTLSRFLVTLIAGAMPMPGVEVAGEPIPVRVAFRDFVEKRLKNPNLSLLDYLDLQARTELSLTLPKDFLRTVIEKGQAVLILDGLDEVGAPEHRVIARDLVLGFSAAYRNIPILITSRIAGYDDAPLGWQVSADRKGTVPVFFEEYELEKFDDNDLNTFVAHWYKVQEPADPVARDHGIANLMAALDADERVRELARTPILATLIAMIHRVEANLPGERAKLYGLCVRMLLETWPAQAKRPFTEIDPGLQHSYLKSLSFAMQESRTSSFEAVTITRGDLVAKLVPILRKRDRANEPEEEVEGVIERWIDHLEKHSGILIEQSTGVYAFFHLSIMEYLAAKGMERERGRGGAVEVIAEHFNGSVWQEVCLLAVGVLAEDEKFLDAVYERVRMSEDIHQWDFLIRCLLEEARLRHEQRECILDRYAATLLQYGDWFTDLSLIDQIQRFSIRHGEAVQRWIEHRLDHNSGDALAATAAVAMESNSKAVLGRLMKRTDRSAAAEVLLEFWPGSEIGDWSVGEADAAAALSWSRKASHDLALLRGVASLGQLPESLAAAAVIILNGRTLQSCAEGAENVVRVSGLVRPGGLGLPAHITIEPGHGRLPTVARAPIESRSRFAGTSQRFARDFARNLAQDFAHYFASDFASDFESAFSSPFVGIFAGVFSRDFASNFARDSASDFSIAFASAFERYFARYFSSDFEGYFSEDFVSALARAYAGDFAQAYAGHFALDFTELVSVPPPLSLTPALSVSVSEERAVANLFAPIVGEVWIALATMAKSESADERLAYILLRLQNRWLFEIWSVIDQRLPENPSPAHLALYFALGWAQSTTTWAWPDSERWRTLFAAGPGEHWLVRSQWHLCKLTDDPASKDDDAGLRAALRDGHGDESLPGYAARLSEVLGIEG